MPFTFAHPAIVLPFIKRKYFSATALIAGSMAPDMEYFLKMKAGGVYGHTFWGMFYFDLPITILMAFSFHVIIKDELIRNLPAFLSRRFFELKMFNFKIYFINHYFIFLLSALLGISSHLIWDSFTHNHGFMVKQLVVMQTTFIPFDGVRYPIWYVLQNISTAIGLIVIAVFVLSIKPSGNYEKAKISYWLLLTIIALAIYFIRYFSGSEMNFGSRIVSMVASILAALMIVSLVLRFRQTRR